MTVEDNPFASSLEYIKGLNNSKAIFFGNPHWCNFNSGPVTITDLPEKSTRLPRRFCLNLPCFPLSISDNDLSGRLFAPVITLPRRPLSNNASTDSCSILFSFRTIISGARNSINRFKRLFLLITLRYRSFRSEVANRPPSKGTNGRNSGGITGTTVRTIHSGLLPDSKKFSTIFNLLIIFFGFSSPVASAKSLRNCSASASRSIFFNISLIASAPIPAVNASIPNVSCASINSSSVSKSP